MTGLEEPRQFFLRRDCMIGKVKEVASVDSAFVTDGPKKFIV